MKYTYLSLEDILRLHYQVIEDFGGSHGVREEGRLKSVIEAPQQEVFGEEQYPSLHEKAAVYLRNIIGDHPFSDGNKRTAVTVCAIFLLQNGSHIVAEPKELEDFTVGVATDNLDIDAISSWLKSHDR
jgi:death-on-curing protein